ncbi:MAG: hypothetical protein MRY63_06985 [Neomegalonema sp.]|nr:hypothetical protein [Neomegalonema sp.]
MSLFKAFSSKPKEQNGSEWRREERRDVSKERPGYEAVIEGARFKVMDISDDGFAISADEASAPTRGIAEISRGGAQLRYGYVMRAWGEGRLVGYRYAKDLQVERLAAELEDRSVLARGMRRRLSAEIDSDDAMRQRRQEAHKPLFQGKGNSVSGMRERLGYDGRKNR